MSREDVIMYYICFLFILQENLSFSEKFGIFCRGLRVCTGWCYVGGREHIGTRPKYGFCPRSRRHSGLRFVLVRYIDSSDISLRRGIGK